MTIDGRGAPERGMSSVRKLILLSESQNERLRKLRAATGISESEIIRRALDAYDPSGGAGDAANDELRDALAALVEQNAKTARAGHCGGGDRSDRGVPARPAREAHGQTGRQALETRVGVHAAGEAAPAQGGRGEPLMVRDILKALRETILLSQRVEAVGGQVAALARASREEL